MRQSQSVLRTVVRHYRLRATDRQAEDAWWRAEGCSFAEAIARAAGARARTGKHDHQIRIPLNTLAEAAAALGVIEGELAECKTFEELFGLVQTQLEPIVGIGELAVYDTAERLAHRLKLPPNRVHLHRGTRIGAMALVDGLRTGDKSISINQLPPELRELGAREAEDVLCIYKDVFLGLRDVPPDNEVSCGRKSKRRGPVC